MDFNPEENLYTSIERFERMLKTDNVYFFDSQEFENIIKYYLDHAQINLAKKALVLAMSQHPDTSSIQLLQAELFIIQDKFEKAVQLLDTLTHIEPNNEDIYIQKALLLSKKEQHLEAIELLKKALKLAENDDTDVLSLIGMEFMFLDDFANALAYFKRCIRIDTEDDTLLHNVVYCFNMLNRQQDSINYLNKYINNNPYSEIAWHQLGLQYAQLNRHYDAIRSYEYALLVDEFFIGAYVEKAKSLEAIYRNEEAIENYLLSVKIDDASAFVYFKIAENYRILKDFDNAIKYYLESIEQDPYLDKPLIALSELYLEQNNFRKAIYYLNKLIDINDENPKYWKLFAKANLKIPFYKEAAKSFEKCIQLGDRNLNTYLDLADTHFLNADFNEAIKVLLEAEIYYGNQSQIDYRLSGYYFRTGSPMLGKKHLLNALNHDSSNYKLFKSMFPSIHHSKMVKNIVLEFQNL